MFFYYKKICEEEDISDFENWFNIFVSKNELETLNGVLKSRKSNSKKRL